MTKPMSDERLAEIRRGQERTYDRAVVDLLAEVDRLRAERERVVDALSDVGRTAEGASGDLEDGVNAELLTLSSTVGEAETALQRVRECVASMSWEHALVKARDIRRALDGSEAGR